jgi:RND family efflux transporter MFP subunit
MTGADSALTPEPKREPEPSAPPHSTPAPEPKREAEPSAPPPRARTRTMLAIGIVLLALFVILLVVGVIPRVRNKGALAAAANDVRTAVPAVYVLKPKAATDAGLTLAGTTQAIQDSIIYARTSGYLKRHMVDIGDRVKAGQLLAEIEAPEVVQQLRQAQANLVQSEKTLDLQRANLHLAKLTMDRYVAANAEKAVAVELVDQSVATYSTAQAAVAAAEATVESNRANVQYFTDLTSFQRVLAPFNGTVLQRNVDAGALITAGSPTDNTAVAPTNLSGTPNGLFEVARIDILRVFVNVPQPFAGNVRKGLPAKVRLRGHLDQPVDATVTRTSNSIDPGTRTLLSQVDVPNPTGRLLPGLFVYVDFQIAPSGTRWRLPATALIFDTQGTRVASVTSGNTIHFLHVDPGRDFGDSIDIQGGLQGNESIVAQPTVSLREGQVVSPLAAQSPH